MPAAGAAGCAAVTDHEALTAEPWSPHTAEWLARRLKPTPWGGYELLHDGQGRVVLVWVDWRGGVYWQPEA